MKTAKFIRSVENKENDGRIYQLSEPVKFEGRDCEKETPTYETTFYVYVSASYISAIERCETYIFPHDGEDTVLDWCELEGSVIGFLDHDLALERAGYKTIGRPE